MEQVLSIAGYDSNGSAGLSADLHSFYADHVYGHGVLTGAVAENASAVTATQPISIKFIEEEFKDLAEFDIKAAKTGMMATPEIINCVADAVKTGNFGPLVLDPVIVTKRHDKLISDDAITTLRQRLVPLATMITPNYDEAEVLIGQPINSPEDMMTAANDLQSMGAKNVVIKGPHKPDQDGNIHNYVLLEDKTSFWLANNYVDTNKINGAGDSLSAVIAAELAKGSSVADAVKTADKFVNVAIHHPLNIGENFGPINHWAGQESL